MSVSFDVFTMGFSNRSWEETVVILRTHEIQRLIDIRTLPGSRRTPQFNQENLQRRLPEAGIEYIHMKSLGSLRKPVRNLTINAGWHNDGFRAYADYMQSTAFTEALETLLQQITGKRSVYVCTEAVFWRCHRQLVSDALVVRGLRVGHILGREKVEEHVLTPFARVDGLHITYPGIPPAA
jgi:uncharacterized protein (DUF488 family)